MFRGRGKHPVRGNRKKKFRNYRVNEYSEPYDSTYPGSTPQLQWTKPSADRDLLAEFRREMELFWRVVQQAQDSLKVQNDADPKPHSKGKGRKRNKKEQSPDPKAENPPSSQVGGNPNQQQEYNSVTMEMLQKQFNNMNPLQNSSFLKKSKKRPLEIHNNSSPTGQSPAPRKKPSNVPMAMNNPSH